MSLDLIATPGQLTDQQSPADFGWLKAHGYEWVSFQAVNGRDSNAARVGSGPAAGAFVKDRDLGPAKRAGLSAGIWAVTYGDGDTPHAGIFYRDGYAAGMQALKLGADHLIADIEQCGKDTRANRGLRPFVKGAQDAGWHGPVHLCPLGAPSNPDVNDFAMDTESFEETGGGLLPQAYLNDTEVYAPNLCIRYWKRVAPSMPVNVMIGMYAGKLRRINGAEWAAILKDAGVGRNFSIYMTEMLVPYDLEGLDALAKSTAPTPTPEPKPVTLPNPADVNAKIAALADTWLEPHEGDEPLARLRAIKRIATTTDAEWVEMRGDVVAAIDGDITVPPEVLAELDKLRADLAAREADVTRLIAQNAALQRKIANAKTALG